MKYIAAIDQGTTSTRSLIFNHKGEILSSAQREHKQYYPKAGWVEHDPLEILINTRCVFSDAINKLGISREDIAGLGITNQRETTLLWNRETGESYGNAIVWQDTRTDKLCETYAARELGKTFIEKTGLPISTYFSGPKIRWLIENNKSLKKSIFENSIRKLKEETEFLKGYDFNFLPMKMLGIVPLTEVKERLKEIREEIKDVNIDWLNDVEKIIDLIDQINVKLFDRGLINDNTPVSYTHLTLPTN